MQQPRRVKYRKTQRGRMKGMATTGSTLAFGEYGLKVVESSWLTSRQIEAARRAIVRHFRRGGNFFFTLLSFLALNN